MPFELGASINKVANWVSSAPIVRTIVNNAAYSALLITALIAVIVWTVMRDELTQAGKLKRWRALIYSFVAVTLSLFVQHGVVSRAARDEASRQGIRDICAGIRSAASAAPAETVGGAAGPAAGPATWPAAGPATGPSLGSMAGLTPAMPPVTAPAMSAPPAMSASAAPTLVITPATFG